MKRVLGRDAADLIFRGLFSSIFLGLGLEHLFSDRIIEGLMWDWLGPKRVLSVLCGWVLLAGASSLILGYRIREGATLLAAFLLVVTAVIHVPGLFIAPRDLPTEWHWLWDVFQRSNLVKNVCLLGVCIHLATSHETGRYSLDASRTPD